MSQDLDLPASKVPGSFQDPMKNCWQTDFAGTGLVQKVTRTRTRPVHVLAM